MVDARQSMQSYEPPAWLPGAHAQTIFPATLGRRYHVPYRRERWMAPDDDFIEVDWLDSQLPASDTLVLFHGLEGNSASHYARAVSRHAQELGWNVVIPHFRGCGGEPNVAPRFYHAGDSAEVEWIMQRVRSIVGSTRVHALGVSLGGSCLLRWLGERGQDAASACDSAISISAPLDLAAGGASLSSGFNMFYTRIFLSTLKAKCDYKLAQYPGLFDRDRMRAARTLREFDDVVTAPLHGFRDTDDYWKRASAKTVLGEITVPTLILNARNDPFMPGHALPDKSMVSDAVRCEFPAQGGHVGFYKRLGATRDWLTERVFQFLAEAT